jgi:Undecaprenyl-phosphate galactose phosphotransferase WbaP
MVYPEEISNNLWFSPMDVAGIIGLKLHKNLLIPRHQVFKRISEIGMIILSSPILIPILLFISILIYIDSPGRVLYMQSRVGKNGQGILIYKFRTMVPNAHQKLTEILENNPELKNEYEKFKKLKKDPRITRVGSVLRRFSLDELPQLWNVVKGEMSLVGPRPILFEEIEEYGDSFEKTYIKVSPGLTGLWQVSGRNEVSYQQRVRMDRYYVHNWSIWLDIYILMKTMFVWLTQKGAY